MVEDFATFTESGKIYETGLCIIGAGPAGVTLARSLAAKGIDIILLESGGMDFEQDIQDMAAGTSGGFPYYDLAESRLRFFGGTAAIWGGRSAQLDDIDFEKRTWVSHSGWPFGKETLRPYYAQAQKILGLPEIADNALPGFSTPLDPDVLKPAFWQFDEMFDRFTLPSCDDLKNAANVRILLHATATELQTTKNGSAIDAVRIANLQGGRALVKARAFIIATGGIEILRLLLASHNAAHPQGIGNNNDLVGRFFMEHPHARGAHVIVKDARKLFRILPRFVYRHGKRYGMLFRPGEAFQEREALLNTSFTLAVRKHPGENQSAHKKISNKLRHDLSPTRAGRGLWKINRRISTAVTNKMGTALNLRNLSKPGYGLYAVCRAEQAPNSDSRLILSDDKDLLGVPRLQLNWQFCSLDKHSVAGALKALDHELRRLDLGRAEPAAWLNNNEKVWEVDPLVSNHAIGGYHHMGTARMSDDLKQGVTRWHRSRSWH
ncbi:MAG: GMC family oxidoreductase [Gammaproteobacteria bacterium HGW-Gammaproteobacteria-3]|nr:MAG: GMC family oxidoreductase [Gammaproteobacteria bacterium HGW-Gammaproteobacteria-3]